MSKDPIDLRRDYFISLREEIKATKTRVFLLLVIGVIGAPLLTYMVFHTDQLIMKLVAPFAVLLLLVLYLSEQTMLMRAGRYIRKHIESDEDDWEHWIGSFKLRSAERQLFAMFTMVGVFFYTILTVLAINELMSLSRLNISRFLYYFWKYGILIFYIMCTIWAVATMIRFWHQATHTDK